MPNELCSLFICAGTTLNDEKAQANRCHILKKTRYFSLYHKKVSQHQLWASFYPPIHGYPKWFLFFGTFLNFDTVTIAVASETFRCNTFAFRFLTQCWTRRLAILCLARYLTTTAFFPSFVLLAVVLICTCGYHAYKQHNLKPAFIVDSASNQAFNLFNPLKI